MSALLMAAPEDAPGMPMVDDDHQAQTCSEHRRFTTAEAALVHYVAQVREGRGDPGQEVYHCRACRGFHHGGSQVYSLGRLLAENGWSDDVH